MANKKQPYNWNRVRPGDIISFRYKSKSTGSTRIQSILVLNPRLIVNLKDGKKTKHLIGIKLEESNKIQLRLTNKQITLLEKIGDFKKIDEQILPKEWYKILNERKDVRELYEKHLENRKC